jgi:hypothetical protein
MCQYHLRYRLVSWNTDAQIRKLHNSRRLIPVDPTPGDCGSIKSDPTLYVVRRPGTPTRINSSVEY